MNSTIPRWLIWCVIIIAFAGFIDATYLTLVHFLGDVPSCTFIKGCEIVTTSKYSLIFNIPVALFGSLYYLLIFFLGVSLLEKMRMSVVKTLALLTWLGFAASIYFLYLQLFIIGALCLFCMVSFISSMVLWGIGRALASKLEDILLLNQENVKY
jgi:uncharacterized membrane protein